MHARARTNRTSSRTAGTVSVAGLLAAVLLTAGPALVPSAASAALPPPAIAGGERALREVGRGQLRWLGFGIYEASLWTPDGRFDGFAAGEPVALSLWYQRKFTRDELLKITTGEWQRLNLATPAERARWEAQLRSMWRDVQRGENLTAVVVPGQGTRFYDATRELGVVQDEGFGPAFLSIWLDPRSAVRDLRVQLLGAGR
jgi:hypothetical protein